VRGGVLGWCFRWTQIQCLLIQLMRRIPEPPNNQPTPTDVNRHPQQKADKEDAAVKVADAWEAAKSKAAEERRKTLEDRRLKGAGSTSTNGAASSGGGGGGTTAREQGGSTGLLPREPSGYAALEGEASRGRNAQQQPSFRLGGEGRPGLEGGASAWGVSQQQQQGQLPWQQQAAGDDPAFSASAAQEIGRLRHELRYEAALLRDVVERQAGELAALRSASAVAEANSMAAACELGQVGLCCFVWGG
jgi:hypothetical protein